MAINIPKQKDLTPILDHIQRERDILLACVKRLSDGHKHSGDFYAGQTARKIAREALHKVQALGKCPE